MVYLSHHITASRSKISVIPWSRTSRLRLSRTPGAFSSQSTSRSSYNTTLCSAGQQSEWSTVHSLVVGSILSTAQLGSIAAPQIESQWLGVMAHCSWRATLGQLLLVSLALSSPLSLNCVRQITGATFRLVRIQRGCIVLFTAYCYLFPSSKRDNSFLRHQHTSQSTLPHQYITCRQQPNNMIHDLITIILAAREALLVGGVIDNRLNPWHLNLATSAYPWTISNGWLSPSKTTRKIVTARILPDVIQECEAAFEVPR
jgi:hypothetical protein